MVRSIRRPNRPMPSLHNASPTSSRGRAVVNWLEAHEAPDAAT